MYSTRSIKHARQDRADLDRDITALRAEGRSLLAIAEDRRTAAQTARLGALDAELDTLTRRAAEVAAEVADFERAAAAEIADAVSPGRPTGPLTGGRRYADMFGAHASSLDGWKDAQEFLATLQSGRSDERLRFLGADALDVRAAATGGIGSDGGFAVPTQLVGEWLDASLGTEIVRPRCAVWPMTSATRKVPAWDASTASGGTLYGGFTGNWIGEGDEITPETPKLRMLTLMAKKLGLLTEVSNELAADGTSYEMQLNQAIVTAIGWFLDRACLVGTGAGQPLGILNAPCTISVAKESGQTAATINYTNLTKMFARLHPASLTRAVWVANPTTIPQLLALTITVGDAGSHYPVLTQSDGQFTMFTRPVIFTEKVPVLGTVGDVGLYDFSQYALGLRQDMTLDKSQHVGFTRDTSHYRGILRADGMPTWSAPYTPLNGDTLSPFVTLATRA